MCEATEPPVATALQSMQWPEAPRLLPAYFVEARWPWKKSIWSHRVTFRPILAQALSASSDVLICALCTSEGRGSLDSSWQCPCTMVSISGSREPEEVRDGRSRSDPCGPACKQPQRKHRVLH